MAIKLTKREAQQLTELDDAYQSAAFQLQDFLSELLSYWQEQFNDRSEKWQESEAGQEAAERISTVEGWLDEMPEENTPCVDADQIS